MHCCGESEQGGLKLATRVCGEITCVVSHSDERDIAFYGNHYDGDLRMPTASCRWQVLPTCRLEIYYP